MKVLKPRDSVMADTEHPILGPEGPGDSRMVATFSIFRPGPLVLGQTDTPEPFEDVGTLEGTSLLLDGIAALKRHGFAFDNAAGFYGIQAGPHVAVVPRESIEFLNLILA